MEVPSPVGSLDAHDLLRLELALARRDSTAVPEGLPSLIAPDFVEFGASGRVWDAAAVVPSLARPADEEITIDDFVVHPLSEAVFVATYRMTEVGRDGTARRCLRSSIWVRRGERFVMRFHQGTPTT